MYTLTAVHCAETLRPNLIYTTLEILMMQPIGPLITLFPPISVPIFNPLEEKLQ